MGNDKEEESYLDLKKDEKKKEKKLRKKPEYTEPAKKKPEKESILDSDWEKFKKVRDDFLEKKLEEREKKEPKEGKKPEKGEVAPEKDVKKEEVEEETEEPVKKPYSKVKEHVQTDIDKLYEFVRNKGVVKIGEASKKFGIETDKVEGWGRVLEEHKLVKLHYPPVGEPVLILKKFKTETEGVEKLGVEKRLKPGRRVFIINILIIFGFVAFLAFHRIIITRMNVDIIPRIESFVSEISKAIGIPSIRISYVQAYLAIIVIIIIVVVVVWWLKRRRGK
ncbi:MAG: hypothetical protein JSV39_03285 [Candidatus Aenigmatarchaeota archaeon]|nr:MAG: hypothetical protein JSV39_03285 [Candidatus Aenigmarchaeota archaeon]